MRRIAHVVIAMAGVLAVPVAAQKIKVTTESVPVYVTVMDTEKRLVPDLVLEDFEILDNMKPQTINVFQNKPTPITTTVMIDTSGSMTASPGPVKDGGEAVL